VSATLGDPATDLEGFIRGAAAVSRALGEVSSTFAAMIDHAATTFAALDDAREQLGESIDRLPQTEASYTRTLGRLNPVIARAAAIARAIRPGSQLLVPATRDLADAAEEGVPLLRHTPGLAQRLDHALEAVEEFADLQATNDTALALISAARSLRSLGRDLAPAQLRCNVIGIYAKHAAELASEGDDLGTWLNALTMLDADQQAQQADPAPNLHVNPLPHEGHDECEAGNEPFKPGQRIGNPGGRQSTRTPDTPR
jgi:hypothetical protein